MSVKSTYNFVPALKEEEVYKPDWNDVVSHDIPFSDAESGEIQIVLKAETPVFIRNGHSKKDAQLFAEYLENLAKKPDYTPSGEEKAAIDKYLSFSNVNGSYFIPASSLKGMLRNVLEILTRSRLNKELVNDNRYAFREFTPNSLYLTSIRNNTIHGGWLRQREDEVWEVEECSNLYHIHHSEVDKALHTNFRSQFLGKNPKEKSAKAKYDQCKKSLTVPFSVKESKSGKLNAVYDHAGKHKGTIVFTGQPGRRNETDGRRPSGKVHEFIFETAVHNEPLTLTGKQVKDFKFIYADHDKNNTSPDWKYWRKKLEKGEKIPVFFIKSGDKIKYFGLSYMFKLPYEYSIHEMFPINQYGAAPDFTELLFGRTEKDNSLKGRVMIGHAFSQNAIPEDAVQKEILGSPKASFYPFYLNQEKKNEQPYNTYQKQNELRGFKRYPVRSSLLNKTYSEDQKKNGKMFSHFIPLKSGAEFLLKIRFHNLRKIEIGALLSAITFHKNEDRCFHSLGNAKSLGYGKLKIEQIQTKYLQHSVLDYLLHFEEQMGSGWFESAQIKELLAMASNRNDRDLDFPTLEPNQFNEYKNKQDNLTPFSTQNNTSFISLLSKHQKEQADLQRKAIEEQERKRAEEEKRLSDSLLHSTDIDAIDKFIKEYPDNKNVPDFRNKIEQLRIEEKKKTAEAFKSMSIEGLSDSFEKNKELLNGYFKKNKYLVFSEKQKEQIFEALLNCYQSKPETFQKKKSPAKFNEFPWTDIKKWLGEELALDLYNKIN